MNLTRKISSYVGRSAVKKGIMSGPKGVSTIVYFANKIPFREFRLIVGGKNIVGKHPETNDGTLDVDYIVISAEGFEHCDIWVFRNKANLAQAAGSYELFEINPHKIKALKYLYFKAALILNIRKLLFLT